MYQITADRAPSYPSDAGALAAGMLVRPGAPLNIGYPAHPPVVRNPVRNETIEYSMNMTGLMPAEQAIIESLDAAVHAPRSAAILAAVADEVSAELTGISHARLAWRPIPLETYDRLPDGIASSWVFVLRADCTSGAERHPNSIQRFMSYRGSADMQTWNGKKWVSHVLSSGPQAPIPERWLSIPINVWHRPVMGGGDWVVVSFHTAADDQLIEERPRDDENPDRGPVSVALYAGRQAR
jgi:hypothetical protein